MRFIVLLLLMAATLFGCGFKGPLYLPQPKPVAQPAPPSPTPKQESRKSTGSPGQ